MKISRPGRPGDGCRCSPDGWVSLEARFGAGAVGGVSAAVATKVVAKVVSKGILKASAKALLKVGSGKLAGGAGGVAAGAAAGAAVGPVVPGIGTAVGAAVGEVVAGLAIGVGTEYLMLKLEEAYSREDQRTALVAELEKMRTEALQLLRSGSVALTPQP